ncbi:EpsG family protein [Aeromonas dhakensis]|uniref:EpsG family protein n=1 Tax=Aeromonas dhakensis TaxID=196024 RepID=UPI003987D709
MFLIFILSSILFFILSFLSVCKVEKSAKIYLDFLCLLIIILTASSREFFQTESDDMIRYYESYINASESGYFEYLDIYGREALFESFNWIVAWVTAGALNVNQYAFIIISPTVLFCYLFYKRISPNENASIAFLCLLIPGLMLMETQLVRQTMGFFLFLYAMTMSRYFHRILFILAALMIHSTTIIFVILWFFSERILIRFFKFTKGYFAFPILLLCYFIGLLLSRYYSELVVMMTDLPFIGFKANFLLMLDLMPLVFAKLYIVYFILVCFLCVMIFSFWGGAVNKGNVLCSRLNELQIKYLVFSYTACCFILIFSGVGQLVERFIVLFFSSIPMLSVYILNSLSFRRFNGVSLYPLIVFVFFLYYIFMLLQPSDFSLFNGYFSP